jgi:Fic family protein
MSVFLETPTRIEPCFLEQYSPALGETLTQLGRRAEVLGKNLPPTSASDLANMVRLMNCYYSNLIEGHNPRPRDIERALSGEFEEKAERRNLQLEARAHVRVQEKIDALYARGALPEPASIDFIRWLHREFYDGAPEALLRVGEGDRVFQMVPGEFRNDPAHDVAVGRHLPPSSERVEEFMQYFEGRFRLEPLPDSRRILAMAAAHHRFNYIHPFPDGNGRVSRLMSHAMGLHAGIGAHGLWSISRGLARGRDGRDDYRQMMDLADTPRENDLDGRGNLSLRTLEAFIQWFLDVALDQVEFMTRLFHLDGLVSRLRDYVGRVLMLGPEAANLAEQVLRRGEMPRGAASGAIGLPERRAREILSLLVNAGLLGSSSPKGPVSLRFPVVAQDTLFPQLFINATPAI